MNYIHKVKEIDINNILDRDNIENNVINNTIHDVLHSFLIIKPI